jgi:hypothetical protein
MGMIRFLSLLLSVFALGGIALYFVKWLHSIKIAYNSHGIFVFRSQKCKNYSQLHILFCFLVTFGLNKCQFFSPTSAAQFSWVYCILFSIIALSIIDELKPLVSEITKIPAWREFSEQRKSIPSQIIKDEEPKYVDNASSQEFIDLVEKYNYNILERDSLETDDKRDNVN